MILGNFCLKETLHSEVANFLLPLLECSYVWVQWQPSVLQPELITFLTTTLFHVNEASERNVIPATKRGESTRIQAIETGWST